MRHEPQQPGPPPTLCRHTHVPHKLWNVGYVKAPFPQVNSTCRFGQYEILERIGQGGMKTDYKAPQLNLDRLVALKLLPFGASSGPGLVQRFRTEASAAVRLQHPSIVAVHDVGEHEGQPFFTMDYAVVYHRVCAS